MLKRNFQSIIVATVVSCLALVHALAVDVPLYEDLDAFTEDAFTGPTNGVTGVGTNIAVVSGGVSGASSLAIDIDGSGGVTLAVDGESYTNVWVQVWAKPVFFDNEDPGEIEDSQSCAFFIYTNGHIRGYNSNAWETATNLVGAMPSDTWIGFAAHIDYGASCWDLYVNTNVASGESAWDDSGTYRTRFRKANLQPWGINTNFSGTLFTSMTITNSTSGTCSLDALAVSRAYDDACSSAATNLYVVQRRDNLNQLIGLPPYEYDGTTGLLANQVGDHLAYNLSTSDELRIYDSAGSDWRGYELQDNGLWAAGVGATAPGSVLLTSEGVGLRLNRVGSGVGDALAFYPYGANVVQLATKATVAAETTSRGATVLAYPTSLARVGINVGDKLGFAEDASDGDELWFYDDVTHVASGYFWYGTEWKDYLTGATATREVCPGDGFFYLRLSGGLFEWSPNP